MKLLTATIILLSSVVSFAGRGMPGQKKYETSVNTIVMGPGVLTYDKVCLNDLGQLQTKKAYDTCVKTKRVKVGGDWESVCTKTEKQFFARDLEYTKSVCVRYKGGDDKGRECAKYENQTAYLKTNYSKTVREYTWTGSRRDGDWSLPGKIVSQEVFSVPACK